MRRIAFTARDVNRSIICIGADPNDRAPGHFLEGLGILPSALWNGH